MSVPDYVWEGLEEVRNLIELVASRETSVLIEGETGTGKETIARELHARSGRRGAFVAVSCPDIVPEIFESELFGHEKGAFTGAAAVRKGFVRAAEGGTLFLDEIGELPVDLQAKLLRVLQQREVKAVGADTARPSNFRLVAATNRDLQLEVSAKAFRLDLFHRIGRFPIKVPPFRDRPPRARHAVIDAIAARHRVAMSDTAREWLLAHPHPGNIRQLDGFVERAAILAAGGVIEIVHFGSELQSVDAAVRVAPDEIGTIAASLPEFKSWPAEVQRAVRTLAEVMIGCCTRARQSGASREQASRDLMANLEVPESWPGFEVLVHALVVAIQWDLATNWPEHDVIASSLSTIYGGTFTRGRQDKRKPLREKIRQLVVERPRG